MIEHELNKLDNFIGGWYIDHQLCDNIRQYHINNKDKWSEGCITKAEAAQIVDKESKHSFDLYLNGSEHYAEYMTVLSKVVDQYHHKYQYSYPMEISDHEGTNIQYYPPGGGYFSWHCERGTDKYPHAARHLVFMTYLNDVTDAGETEFYYQKIKVKPEKGLTLIWPSDWTFTHRGITSLTQEKWIVTGWLHFSSDQMNFQMLKKMGVV